MIVYFLLKKCFLAIGFQFYNQFYKCCIVRDLPRPIARDLASAIDNALGSRLQPTLYSKRCLRFFRMHGVSHKSFQDRGLLSMRTRVLSVIEPRKANICLPLRLERPLKYSSLSIFCHAVDDICVERQKGSQCARSRISSRIDDIGLSFRGPKTKCVAKHQHFFLVLSTGL